MDIKAIERKAAALRAELGGTIFVFPIEETNPFSKYVVTVWTGEKFSTFPGPQSVEEAAQGVKITLELFKKEGIDSNFARTVRFISYEAQINAPSVTMRRLKNDPTTHSLLR